VTSSVATGSHIVVASGFAYEHRVRDTTYLWGSPHLTRSIHFASPPLLHIRNHVFGENAEIGLISRPGHDETLGTLEPGQVLSLPLDNLTAVYATCPTETTITCAIERA